jgi:hypothetical protein
MDFINECSTQDEVKRKLKSDFVIQNRVCVSEKQRAFLHNFFLIQVMYINQIFKFQCLIFLVEWNKIMMALLLT